MLKKSIGHLIALCFLSLILIAAQFANAGEITLRKMASKVLAADYPYTIYLPDGYESGELSYPVLYLLHGNGGNENNWIVKGHIRPTTDTLIEEGNIPPIIIVMPGHGTSWWVDGNKEPAETVLIKELIPHIDANFRTIDTRDGRMIAGLSAGGYGTVNAVFKYPELFASCAALSPAVYVPLPPSHSSANRVPPFQKDGKFDPATWKRLNYPANWEAYKAKEIIVPMYINTGDHDTFAIAYHAALLFQKLFEYQPKEVEYRVIDGDHEWSIWRDTIGDALKYVTSYVSQPQIAEP
jgi:enterochelin esterase-like enzyme